jgi:copper chaperone NosL
MACGLIAAGIGRRWSLFLWTGLFMVVALAGLADFWYWGYDYGHDLDPTAAIKVPGLSYQPPVIGSKQLLNFTAHSWPGAGGWAIAGALATGIALCVAEIRRARRSSTRRARHAAHAIARHAALSLAIFGALVTLGCAEPGPDAIHYDTDACDHCRMTIASPSFAAQLVTRTGKVYRFDDPGCLAAFVAAKQVPIGDVHSVWVNDHARPGSRVKAQDAVFLVSGRIRSPMNSGTAAFASREAAATLQSDVGGQVERWNDLLKRAAS